MDAFMAALLAALLAGTDGRAAKLVERLLEAGGAARVWTAFAIATLLNCALSAVGGVLAGEVIGLGVLTIFLAFAAIGGAIAVLWRHKEPRLPATDSMVALTLGIFLIQFGDATQFLIGAVAATSGAGLWAAIGGAIGIGLALVPGLFAGSQVYDRPGMRAMRWIAAALLTITAIRAVVLAFGLA